MSRALQQYLTPDSRRKIYLIPVFVSLALFFYGAWQVKPVIVEVEATLGLASYLSPGYWIGLAIILVTSICVFLDRQLKNDAIFIAVLLVLGLFLLGIRVFVEANALDPDSYYPTSVVKTVLATGHIDIMNSPHIASYYSWPAIHFISASLLEVTGADLLSIMKYTPLFWILCFVFITYGIGKRFKLEPHRCFLLSFLAVSSWLATFAGFYYPRFPATVLLLLLFMLLIVPRRTAAETVLVVLMFTALVLSHGLTSVAIVPGLVLLAIYRKEYRLVVLFLVIFGAWYMYQAPTAIEVGIQAFAKPLMDILDLTRIERYQGITSTTMLVTRYSQLTYAALYGGLMMGSSILLLRQRITGERRRQVILLLCWAIGVAMVVLWGHGQAVFRAYIYIIPPMATIIVLSFSSRKLMIPLMCLFVALSPLANYASLAGWGQVLTTELKGAEFFALQVKPNPQNGFEDSYFYAYTASLILYCDPALVRVPGYVHPFSARSPAEVDLSIMDGLRYVIISRLGSERFLYGWGEDPYGAWPKTEAGQKADLIYNNRYFQIYEGSGEIRYR